MIVQHSLNCAKLNVQLEQRKKNKKELKFKEKEISNYEITITIIQSLSMASALDIYYHHRRRRLHPFLDSFSD